jgi:hypothetical protein
MWGMWWNGKRTARRVLWALFWIALGAFILLSNYGMYNLSLKRDWPILLIAYGLVSLIDLVFTRGHKPPPFQNDREERKRKRQDILLAVQEGRMKAEDAAEKLRES